MVVGLVCLLIVVVAYLCFALCTCLAVWFGFLLVLFVLERLLVLVWMVCEVWAAVWVCLGVLWVVMVVCFAVCCFVVLVIVTSFC